MTSPVDTTVVYSHNLMAAAPVLVAQAGSMINLLDALLINGFDTKAADSISISNGFATVFFTGLHSSEQESVINVSGATGIFTDINGRQKVVTRLPNSLTFKTLLPDGLVTGTVSFVMASAGWSKPFAALNIAVYKSTDPMANGHYLRVDDTDNLSARIRGFETMSDVNTGTGPFPTDAQLNNYGSINPGSSGGYWFKGSNVTTNPVGWTFCSDSRFFMICPQTYQSQNLTSQNYSLGHFKGFGDPIVSRPSGDPYSTLVSIGYPGAQNSTQGGSFSQGDTSYGSLYTPRPYYGIGSSERSGCFNYSASQTSNEGLSGTINSFFGRFPSVIDGSIRYVQKFTRKLDITSESDYCVRANIPGIVHIPMSGVYSSLPPKTVINGSGFLNGRKLVSVGVGYFGTNSVDSADASGIVLIDITGPWR